MLFLGIVTLFFSACESDWVLNESINDAKLSTTTHRTPKFPPQYKFVIQNNSNFAIEGGIQVLGLEDMLFVNPDMTLSTGFKIKPNSSIIFYNFSNTSNPNLILSKWYFSSPYLDYPIIIPSDQADAEHTSVDTETRIPYINWNLIKGTMKVIKGNASYDASVYSESAAIYGNKITSDSYDFDGSIFTVETNSTYIIKEKVTLIIIDGRFVKLAE